MKKTKATKTARGIKYMALAMCSLLMTVTLQATIYANTSVPGEPVIVIDTSLNAQAETAKEEPATPPAYPGEPEWVWLPNEVVFGEDNGFSSVRRTYALPPYVNPAVISTDSFTMFGQQFNFAYVLQRATAHEESREVLETVTINTSSRNINDIIPYLEQSIVYDRDGFIGTLTLNVQSISSQAAGTSMSTSTAMRRRTFPHLPAADNSLIPRYIVEGGITFNLQSVDWSGSSSIPVDGHQVATSHTATATFSTQLTSTRTTGYVTTAEFVGTVYRSMPGATLYTAVFYGQAVAELIMPEVNDSIRHQYFHGLPTRNNALLPQAIADGERLFLFSSAEWTVDEYGAYTASALFAERDEAVSENGNGGDSNRASGTSTARAPREPREPRERNVNVGGILTVLGVLAAIAAAGVGGFFLAVRYLSYNVTVNSIHGPHDIVKAGKIKVNFDVPEPEIVIDEPAFKVPAKTDRYVIQIAKRVSAKIAGKTLRIVLKDMEAFQEVPTNIANRDYEFRVDFSDDDELFEDDDHTGDEAVDDVPFNDDYDSDDE